MTKDDWSTLENSLSHAYGSAKILVDGFEVSFQVMQDKMRLVICPYVNGWMKGEWLNKKTEECTRFYRPVTVSLYSPSQIKKMTKGLRKSTIKAYFPNLNKKHVYYSFEWLSFRSMKNHLIANNKSITLVKLSDAALEGGV